MAIPLDAISIVIRNDQVQKRIIGGLLTIKGCSNATFRTDGEISAVSFQSDLDAFFFIQSLKGLGLRAMRDFSGLNGLPPWVIVQEGPDGPEFVMVRRGRPIPTVTVSIDEAAQAIVEQVSRINDDLSSAKLPEEYYYSGLPQCVIDAVFSVGARYESTRKAVRNFCERQQPPWPLLQGAPGDEPALRDLVYVLRSRSLEDLAKNVFGNSQRTSTGAKGILKAEATLLFAEALLRHGINRKGDIAEADRIAAAKDEIVKNVPGQSSGISFDYFLMLAGRDGDVKADRMIRRFVGRAIGLADRQLAPQDISVEAVKQAATLLRRTYCQITPRLVDHIIWNYERGRK